MIPLILPMTDASSSDSDFTVPPSVLTSANISSFPSNAFQRIVKDVSATEVTGSEDSDKDGAFDDYF
ncbi:hypothetical protein CRYUN_Cryun23aG0078200 [Craigia yunnanensis]